MGLSIHYSATICSRETITALIEETTDIAESLSWKYNIIDDEQLYGITVYPEKCIPLFLTFAPNLKLCSAIAVLANDPGSLYYYTAFTKTQFAGEGTHIALLKLLKYVSDKYFSEIEVSDEGGYWELWDKNILSSQFEKYNNALYVVAESLSAIKYVEGEIPEALADRIEALLRKKFDNL